MVHIAVAGGTGDIGQHIVEAILATKKHTVTVISRSPTHPYLQSLGVNVIAVDYASHTSLLSALQGVNTVISTIWTIDDSLATNQLALLQASIDAGVKRFVPSDWSIASISSVPITAYRPKIIVANAVKKSGLEYTIFESGVCMNYFALGTKGIGHLKPLQFLVDVGNCTARIPGTGDEKVVFTRAEDLGAFVAASLDIPSGEWPERSAMAGDVMSYNEVIALAEKVRGRQFTVIRVSAEELRKELVPDPPSLFTNFYAEAMLSIMERWFVFETNLNKLCPEVRPTGVEEFLREWWTETS